MTTPDHFCILTKDDEGRCWLNGYAKGLHLGRIQVRTGVPWKQSPEHFRTRPNEVRGQLEPVPEDCYVLGPIEWASGLAGNYNALYDSVGSPMWQVINPDRAIGFHLDAGSPGTAGCVGFITMADLKTFCGWQLKHSPFTHLYVDWGLGFSPAPNMNKENAPPMEIYPATVNYNGIPRPGFLINNRLFGMMADGVELGVFDWAANWDATTKTGSVKTKGSKDERITTI